MDKRFVFWMSLLCSIFLIGHGTYFLFIGEGVQAEGKFRDLKPLFDLIPGPAQGLLDLLLGVFLGLISFFTWAEMVREE